VPVADSAKFRARCRRIRDITIAYVAEYATSLGFLSRNLRQPERRCCEICDNPRRYGAPDSRLAASPGDSHKHS
jgi:hypothetical protein